MNFVEINQLEYEDWLQKFPNRNFLQSGYEGAKMQHDGWDVKYYRAKKDNQVFVCFMICIRPLLKFFRYAYIPRGVLFEDVNGMSDFWSSLKKLLRKMNIVYLETDPYIILQERDKDGSIVEGGKNNFHIVDLYKQSGFEQLPLKHGYDPLKQCRWMSVLDLKDKDEKMLLDAMSTHTRADVRLAQRNHVKVRKLAYDELYILKDIVEKTSERRNFEASSLDYFQDEYKYFKEHAFALYAYLDLDEYVDNLQADKQQVEAEKEKVALKNTSRTQKKIHLLDERLVSLTKKISKANEWQKEYGNTLPLAGSMFIHYGNEIVYLVSGSLQEFQQYRGPYAIQWHAIKEALKQGCSYYNFYGISGCFEPDQEGYGVFAFKRGFNADVVELIGNFILPIRPLVYKLFKIKNG